MSSSRYIKRQRILVLCLVWVGLHLGCLNLDSPINGERNKKNNVLRYDVTAPFTNLDPSTTIYSGGTNVFPFLYSYLFVPDEAGELAPDLALRWHLDGSQRQWTIHLRDDARFHNHRPVNAHDVKFSLEKAISNRKADLRSTIQQITATADHVLTIGLAHEAQGILQEIWDIEIVPKPLPSPTSPTPIVGSGPFQLVSVNGDRQVTLKANPDYFGGAPALERIHFFYEPDQENTWARLLSGTTDIGHELSPDNFTMAAPYSDRFYFDNYTLRYYTILLYNTQLPLFSDVRVRRALTLAIDRETIVEQILHRFGRVATGPMGVDSPYRHPQMKPLPFDPERAGQLLQAAGWRLIPEGRLVRGDRSFEFELAFFKGKTVDKKVARFVQLCLHNLGIVVRLRPLDYDQLLASYFQNDRFQAVITELNGAYREPGYVQRIWSAGLHGRSYAGAFSHPEINRLVHHAFTQKDPSQKKALL